MRAALLASAALFTANYALGLSLQLGARLHVRFLHHALFFLTCAAVALTGLLAWRAGSAWWPSALTFGALLLVTRTRPGRPAHYLTATAAGALLAVTAWRLP